MNKESKNYLRTIFLKRRKEISDSRRFQASSKATDFLMELVKDVPVVASFASLPYEINLWPINHLLAKQKKLVLPTVIGNELKLFAVDNLNDLKLSPLNILEPDPKTCRQISCREIGLILVPGISFDCVHTRLGYGKGHYDRLLAGIRQPRHGIGFNEQLSMDPLPQQDHDQKMDIVHLF